MTDSRLHSLGLRIQAAMDRHGLTRAELHERWAKRTWKRTGKVQFLVTFTVPQQQVSA